MAPYETHQPVSPTMPPPADDAPRRKKKRNIGSFPCSKCSKVFSRNDHLARHYLNHQPKVVYVCEHTIVSVNGTTRSCGKTFVRKDLRLRHMKRHALEAQQASADSELLFAAEPTPLAEPGGTKSDDAEGDDPEQPPEPQPRASLLAQASSAKPFTHEQPNADQPVLQASRTSVAGYQGEVDPAAVNNIHHAASLSGPPQGHLPMDPGFVNRPQMVAEPLLHSVPPGVPVAPDSYLTPSLGPYTTHPAYAQRNTAPAPGPVGMPKQEDFNSPFNSNDMAWSSQHMLQSLNDIILWLFMDSPENQQTMRSSPGSVTSSNAEMANNTPAITLQSRQKYQLYAEEYPRIMAERNAAWNSFQPSRYQDSMYNLGLQDLNYFLNNPNPLDEVFLRLQSKTSEIFKDDDAIQAFAMLSTGSSNSPTNTNDTCTPHSSAEVPPIIHEQEPVASRLPRHAANVNFPQNKHLYVDEIIMSRLFAPLPQLSIEKLLKTLPESKDARTLSHRISFYLYSYWESFHPRFSILHEPSFDTSTAEPLLLLAMVIIGCMYSASSLEYSQKQQKCPEYKLCMLIAVPLRFELFQHPDFRSPVKVWVLQTLKLLEWCEKNYLSRAMHERAHIHHGTTIQLLRRSPFLGGNPAVTAKNENLTAESASGSEDDQTDGLPNDGDVPLDNDAILFKKWLDSESMNRITFMTFYLDIIDYIKFRHNPQVPFHQLQLLNLPCDEKLWNCKDLDGSFRKLVKMQRKLQKRHTPPVKQARGAHKIRPGMNFLVALKRLLKPQKSIRFDHHLSTFTKTILVGGIVSVMHQMQQNDMQKNFLILASSQEKQEKSRWKELVIKALDACESEMHSISDNLSTDLFFALHKGQCRFPMYHLIQIMGISDVNHYDIAIYGGSPRNMSVEATVKDLSIVQRKLTTIWRPSNDLTSLNTLVNLRCLVHCYWLLWGLMLTPLDEDGSPTHHDPYYPWDVDHDCYDLMYAVSIATLVLWCYNYSSNGAESNNISNLSVENPDQCRDYDTLKTVVNENGYEYLYRIREQFNALLDSQGLTPGYILHTARPEKRLTALFDVLQKHCELLPQIPNKHNIAGLCFLVGLQLLNSQWEVVRENAKLVINCGLRSIGKRNAHCPDLFDNEFLE